MIDVSLDGEDLFFTTGVSLLPQDPAQIDVYDARVGGGFPQPAPPPPCDVDADNCRKQGTATRRSPRPASTQRRDRQRGTQTQVPQGQAPGDQERQVQVRAEQEEEVKAGQESRQEPEGGPMRRLATSLLAAALLSLALVAPAQGAFGLEEFNSGFLKADEPRSRRAKRAPIPPPRSPRSSSTPRAPDPEQPIVPDGAVKDVTVSLPPGFVGDPTAVTPCPTVQFTETGDQCPAASRVGLVEAFALDLGEVFDVPLYNIAPPPGQVLRLGFKIVQVPVTIDLKVNPDPPFNVLAAIRYTSNAVPIYGSTVRISGAPPGATRPFLTMPRACTGPLGISYKANSWEAPGAVLSDQAPPVTIEKCEELGFDPTVSGKPTSAAAESPSGLDFDFDVDDPGLTEFGGTADSDIKKTVVTLPAGASPPTRRSPRAWRSAASPSSKPKGRSTPIPPPAARRRRRSGASTSARRFWTKPSRARSTSPSRATTRSNRCSPSTSSSRTPDTGSASASPARSNRTRSRASSPPPSTRCPSSRSATCASISRAAIAHR